MTREWLSPAAKHVLEKLKPLLASTKCGGELKDVLEEFARLLVCDDDFSCQIEREINVQRKSAQKSILVCHYTLATQARSGARSSTTATALDAVAISPAV